MKPYSIYPRKKKILADMITPVSLYLKVRDIYPNAVLLESSDYHSSQNSYSYICLQPLADYTVADFQVTIEEPDGTRETFPVENQSSVPDSLNHFVASFVNQGEPCSIDGVFGYTAYDAIQYFEDIQLQNQKKEIIPDMRYRFYKFIIAVNHLKNELEIIENLFENEKSQMQHIESLLTNRNYAVYNFSTTGDESSNLTDQQYMQMVSKGKEHCFRGDVFQIVLSRQFTQSFLGDDFNVYRSLRSINPSPYLFYFDYGSYRIFGSSPETQIEITGGKAFINPIAGTFKRTGHDQQDAELAEKLSLDRKENAEHIMLVDLARNDLSRTTRHIQVDKFREIHFYSHVIHMVSRVSGELKPGANTCKIFAESFPAGTLSGAPKFKAMELIDQYENKNRGYYGGAIGNIRLNGDINQAIMIRSFLSRDNTLFYQAGAGVVSESLEENELAEVNNKLGALKLAIVMATQL